MDHYYCDIIKGKKSLLHSDFIDASVVYTSSHPESGEHAEDSKGNLKHPPT